MSYLKANRRAFYLVLLFVGIGFCQPMHVFPLPNFIEELLVALGVLVAAGSIFWRADQLRLSVFTVMWVTLGLILLVSSYAHTTPFVSYETGYAIYWFVGLMALLIGEQIDWIKEGPLLSKNLAIALLLISLLCAVGGFIRFYGLTGDLWRAWVPEPNTGRVTGLVGHSNFFAFISFFGLLAAGWLLNAGQLHKSVVLLSLVVLVCAIIGSGNRAVLVSWFSVILVLAFRRNTSGASTWLYFMAGSFVFYWLFRPFYYVFDQWLYAAAHGRGWVGGAGTGDSDVLVRGALSTQRLAEWTVTLELISQNFWGGIGVGNYAVSSFKQNIASHAPNQAGLFIHSHSSPLQVVLDFGVMGVLWLISLFAVASRAIWRASADINRLLPVLVVLTIQIYGLFEFPLWMMHFLALHMVLLGSLSEEWKIVRFNFGKLSSVVVLALATIGFVAYVPLIRDFVWSYRQTFIRADVPKDAYAFVDRVIADPILQPYGYMLYFNNFDLAPETLDRERVAVNRMSGFLPYPQVLVRLALIKMIDKDEFGARKVLGDMRAFYGLSGESVLAQQIAASKKKFPTVAFEKLMLPKP